MEQESFAAHSPALSTKELTGLILLFSPSPSSSWIFEKSQKNLKSVCERRQRHKGSSLTGTCIPHCASQTHTEPTSPHTLLLAPKDLPSYSSSP